MRWYASRGRDRGMPWRRAAKKDGTVPMRRSIMGAKMETRTSWYDSNSESDVNPYIESVAVAQTSDKTPLRDPNTSMPNRRCKYAKYIPKMELRNTDHKTKVTICNVKTGTTARSTQDAPVNSVTNAA